LLKDIYGKIDGIKKVYMLLLSRIGMPVDSPQVATAQALFERGRRFMRLQKLQRRLLKRNFQRFINSAWS
jgi:S-adenosylmethionine synthetase